MPLSRFRIGRNNDTDGPLVPTPTRARIGTLDPAMSCKFGCTFHPWFDAPVSPTAGVGEAADM